MTSEKPESQKARNPEIRSRAKQPVTTSAFLISGFLAFLLFLIFLPHARPFRQLEVIRARPAV